ncbi:hypothetical protein HanPSC8_Chr14g0596731 [Helianthus annuus]|nr:hypothetical protein HanPSC8_Chr14g0596731 [Helianthus annuus]
MYPRRNLFLFIINCNLSNHIFFKIPEKMEIKKTHTPLYVKKSTTSFFYHILVLEPYCRWKWFLFLQ